MKACNDFCFSFMFSRSWWLHNATRLCATISSSHSFGALWNVVMFQKCSGNSLTQRENKARFDTGAHACCGTTLEVPSASFKAQQITGPSVWKHELLSACLCVRPRAFVHETALFVQINFHYHQHVFVSTQPSVSRHVRVAGSKRDERKKDTQPGTTFPLG